MAARASVWPASPSRRSDPFFYGIIQLVTQNIRANAEERLDAKFYRGILHKINRANQ